jgi:hypothetical protein
MSEPILMVSGFGRLVRLHVVLRSRDIVVYPLRVMVIELRYSCVMLKGATSFVPR